MKHIIPLFLSLLLLLACLPTPEEEAVIAPSGYEAAISAPQTPGADALRLPAHWNEVIPLQFWDINIDADLSPSVLSATPVFESSYLTMDDIQAQADTVKRVLLKDAVSCCEDGVMTIADWYREIQAFADTPAWDDKTGGFTRRRSDEEVQSYRNSLEPWIAEAPLELDYRPFSPTTDAISDDAGYRLSDGTLVWMRCQSKSISVLYGAELFYNAVDQPESQVMAGDVLWDEPAGTRIEGVTVEEKAAKEQALALLSALSLDGFKIARIEKARYINDFTRACITAGYQIVFCRAEGEYEAAYNTIAGKFSFGGRRSEETSYRPYWDQEQIVIFIDQSGVRSFSWMYPTATPKIVNENVAILSYAEIQEVIRTHLKNCLSLYEEGEAYREWYAGRAKELVDHVGLYFGIIPKKNDVDAFYYGPVWIVTIRTYPADADVPALPKTMQAQYLHINAIDGSLIDY